MDWVVSFICALAGAGLGLLLGFSAQSHEDRVWVETCWPNKPVWTEGPGTCWVNGQKVVVE